MTIHALEVMPDHVHVLVEAGPTTHAAQIANRFKGRRYIENQKGV